MFVSSKLIKQRLCAISAVAPGSDPAGLAEMSEGLSWYLQLDLMVCCVHGQPAIWHSW